MFKKMLCILSIICLLSVNFGILPVEADAGTDPEPLWLFPTDDATINMNNPDVNYDNDGSSSMDEGEIGHHLASKSQIYTYMKFDISNVNEIVSAKLRIYASDSRSNSKDYIYVYGVDETEWSETTITWNNAPKKEFDITEHIGETRLYRSTDFNLHYIDLKEYIARKVNEGKTSITLVFHAYENHFTASIHSKDLVGIHDGNHGPTAPCIIINEDTTRPTKPQNLTAEAISPEEVQLSWDASTDNVAIAGYEIYIDNELAMVTSDVYAVCGGLQPSTIYSFYVKAVDTSQNVSEPSGTVTERTMHLPDEEPPSIPQNLSGKVLSPSKVSLKWDPSTDNVGVSGYIVYCDNTEIAATDSNGYLGYVVEGLSAGTSYSFSVKAFDIIGNMSGLCEEISVTTLSEYDTEPPTKPVNLQISDYSTYSPQADLTWDASQDNIEVAGYIIYVNGGEKVRVTGTSYRFSDLAPFTQYTIYLKAFDETGNLSEASEALNITTGYVEMRAVGTGQDYATIQAAVNAANPGDVVLVKDGAYIENITVSRSDTDNRYITIMAEGDEAFIYGSVVINGSYIRFSGFKLDNFYNGNYLGDKRDGIDNKGAYNQIVNNRIKDFRYAIICTGTSAYIAGNYIYKCALGLIMRGQDNIFEYNEMEYLDRTGKTINDADYIRLYGKNIIIRNNYCHGSSKEGVGDAHLDFIQSYAGVDEEVKNILVENNIVTGLINQCFMLSVLEEGQVPGIYPISDWVIRNNVFYGFISWGVCGGKANGGIPNLTVENNLFAGDPNNYADYGIVFRGMGGSGKIRNNIIMNIDNMGYGTLNDAVIDEAEGNLIYNAGSPPVPSPSDRIGRDPRFVNVETYDFNLLPDSPAIDAGADVSFLLDLEGNTRRIGTKVDIGPYEFYGIKENTPPDITITSPTAGQIYAAGSDVNVTVYASDDKEVVKVEYFLDGNKIGESTESPFDYMIANISQGLHNLYGIAYDEDGLSTQSRTVSFIAGDSRAMVVGASWVNLTIPAREGITTVTFDAIPLADNMNGVIGVTFGEASEFKNLAAIVRFNDYGLIDAFKGDVTPPYNYVDEVNYSANKNYRFIMNINIPQRLFSAYVIDENEDAHVVAENYPFRGTGAVGASSLDTIGGLCEKGAYVLVYDDEGGVYVPGESVEIEESVVNMQAGSTRTLTATVLPENATIKLLKWESSNPSVATVDKDGNVTALTNGTALITARIAGTKLYDNCIVTVTTDQSGNLPPVFTDVEDKSVNVGSTLEFTVSATDPEDGSLTYTAEDLPDGAAFDEQNRTFTWTPQQGQEGTYQVTFVVSDGVNAQVEMTVVITVKNVQGEGLTITAPDEIAPEKNFSATIGFNLNETILTAGLTVTYNPNLVTYKGHDQIEGGLYAFVKNDETTGTIRILLSGTDNPITSDTPLVMLRFWSKETEGSCEIAVTEAELIDVYGISIFPDLASKTVRVNSVIPGDANDDGVINLRDLHFVSTHFWKDTSSEDWDIAKAADFKKDGKIDIRDLSFVAQRILEQ